MAIGDTGISIEDPPLSNGALMLIVVFLSVALYNFVELNFIIFATFKKRRGLYFWSFLVATWGIAPYVIGFLLKALRYNNLSWLYVTLIIVGWVPLVTGQSVVLYSRLHLIVYDAKVLRAVRWMIIINAIICHVPIIVMVYGANSSNPGPFIRPYSIYEKIQVSIFFIQEVIISGLYIVETTKLMRAQREIRSNSSRRNLMAHLIIVNVVVVVLDITLLGLEYAGRYSVQTAYKGLVYSVKLKVEFSILNKLVDMMHGSTSGSSCDRTLSGGDGVHLELGDRPTGPPGIGYITCVSADQNGNSEATGDSVVMTRAVMVRRDGDEELSDDDIVEARERERGNTRVPGFMAYTGDSDIATAHLRRHLDGMRPSSEPEEHFARPSP